MKAIYQNTQIGYSSIIFFLALLLFLIFVIRSVDLTFILIILFLILLLLQRHSLTVMIRGNCLEVVHGAGIIKRRVLIEDIESFSIENHPWYTFLWWMRVVRWDIHVVSGNDAIVIKLKEDKKYRYYNLFFLANSSYIHIGTNDTKKFAQALENSLRR